MKKVLYILIAAILTVSLSACSKKPEEPIICRSNRPTFDSIEGLVKHFEENETTKNIILGAQSGDTRNISDDVLCMYVPSFKPEGYTLNNVALSGSWIYYDYYAEGYNPGAVMSGSSTKKQAETASSANTEIEPPTSSNVEFYDNKDHQVSDEMLEEIENTFAVGWDYYENSGINCWEEFARINYGSVIEFEEYPGVYYSNGPYDDIVYSKMLYWTQDGYAFQASMSLKVFESITFSEEGLPQLVQPVDYSTVTFEAIE